MTDPALRYLVIPSLDLVTGCLRRYRLLKLLQWRSEKLRMWQNDRLHKLVSHAYRTVPYYAHEFRENRISISHIRKTEDITNLPIVTKDDLVSSQEEVVSETIPIRRMRSTHTSGSTGRPFDFYDDKNARGYVIASRFLFESWMGLALGDRTVKLTTWDYPKWRTRLIGEIRVAPLRLENPAIAVRLIRSLHPASLLGNVSILSSFANGLLQADLDSETGIRAIATTGEVLLSNHRDLIERAFKSPVFDRYGLKEVAGYVAQECEAHQGLHVNGGLVIAEVVKDGEVCGPGETGRLIVTNLHNYATPFIRYDTGDVVTVGDTCSCGRAFPVLTRIEGRAPNWVITESLPVSLTLFVSALETMNIKSIQQFQFIQRKIGELQLLLAPQSALTTEQIDQVAKGLSAIHPQIRVNVEVTDMNSLTESGKRVLFKPLQSDA